MPVFKFGERSRERQRGIDPRVIQILELALQLTLIDFGHPAHAGLRTAFVQNGLYNSGLSGCDGFNKKSKHQCGLAIDVYAYVDGKASWEPEHLSHVANAMFEAAARLGYRLKWGGFFRGMFGKEGDAGHFELYY